MAWEEALDMCTSCTAMELLRFGKADRAVQYMRGFMLQFWKKPTPACLLRTSSHACWGPYDFAFKTITQKAMSAFGATATTNTNPNKSIEVLQRPSDSVSSLSFSPKTNFSVAIS
uniref:Uncharacterized protein n=1 Tax=Populus trichocarpa TaxID=3694 RepID=A0A2K2AT33_POPTR